jgi:predicted TIM-barrel fold metal-dependent hydrolase
MGYIDADTHVVESEHTWDFFDPGEERFKPTTGDGYWAVEDQVIGWPPPSLKQWAEELFTASAFPGLERWADEVFKPGATYMDEPAARLRYMDMLGIDVHVLFPTYMLLTEAANPLRQAALSRSYNRWMAEVTADSRGRLRWALDAPVGRMDRCLEELEFGRDHGAVAVLVRGLGHGRSLSDPSLAPMYEKAQDLDLAITVHVGGDARTWRRESGAWLYAAVMPIPSAFWTVVKEGLHDKFPRLRWGFLETGATWLPFVLQETFRADESGKFRNFVDWRAAAAEVLEEQQLYVTVQMDDDLPHLLEFGGQNRFVHGTDFGHMDVGTDPNGLHIVANRPDIDPAVARKIVDGNARLLYGIDPQFTPAPPPVVEGPVFESTMAAARN